MPTGYPSIDKPWLKYYSREAIEAPLLECTVWEYVRDAIQDNLGSVALSYYGRDMTYGELSAEEMAAHIGATISKLVFTRDASLEAVCSAADLADIERVVVVSLMRSMPEVNRLGAWLKGMRLRHVPDDSCCLSWDGFMAFAFDVERALLANSDVSNCAVVPVATRQKTRCP